MQFSAVPNKNLYSLFTTPLLFSLFMLTDHRQTTQGQAVQEMAQQSKKHAEFKELCTYTPVNEKGSTLLIFNRHKY